MDRILYLQCHLSSSCRQKLEGVLRYAHGRGWRVQVLGSEEMGCTPARAAKVWSACGIIVDAIREERRYRAAEFGDVPSVFLDCGPEPPLAGYPVIVHDSVATARAAIDELAAAGVSSFAFVSYSVPKKSWVEARRQVFVDEMRLRGARYSVYDGRDSLYDLATFRAALPKWILSLPPRTGIFAANDEIADQVLSACETARLRVPEDVAVIGIDNDTQLCENTVPPLSSVQVDFERAGYSAAETLDALISGDGAAPERVMFGPLGVVRRESTRALGRVSAKITDAVRFIREHACEGLRAEDVVRHIGGSRRTAEMRFRAFTGRSILEEIRITRFERLFMLLRRPETKIEAAANFCGWESVESLRGLFRRHVGMTMSEWRERHLDGCPSSGLRKTIGD